MKKNEEGRRGSGVAGEEGGGKGGERVFEGGAF